MRFSVRAPASSANLGPGFDTLALSLTRYLTVEVDTGGTCGEPAPRLDLAGGDDLVLTGMETVARELGRELPKCFVCGTSEIPVARGLGSSAAAIVAGLIAGNHLLGDELGLDELLQLASRIEGHADNIAAALFGGAVVTIEDGGRVRGIPIPTQGELEAVVFLPDVISFTREARAAVPERFSRGDAVFNMARCALLVHALASGDFSLLGEAMDDRIHQPYRAKLYPHLMPMIAGARAAGAYGASLSGSGPSVIALVAPARTGGVSDFFTAKARELGIRGECARLAVADEGVSIYSG
jgi:homoserine kinase